MNNVKRYIAALALLATLVGAAVAGRVMLRQVKAAQAAPTAPQGMSVLYRFSGVTDDGKKGASDRKEATSVLCTNAGSLDATIQIKLYQWNGAIVGNASITAAPMASYTFSTQNTTIYFDDVILGTGGGTESIFQGSGEILSNRSRDTIVCTVEVLDPLGYPPVYADKLALYYEDGTPLGYDRLLYVPTIIRR